MSCRWRAHPGRAARYEWHIRPPRRAGLGRVSVFGRRRGVRPGSLRSGQRAPGTHARRARRPRFGGHGRVGLQPAAVLPGADAAPARDVFALTPPGPPRSRPAGRARDVAKGAGGAMLERGRCTGRRQRLSRSGTLRLGGGDLAGLMRRPRLGGRASRAEGTPTRSGPTPPRPARHPRPRRRGPRRAPCPTWAQALTRTLRETRGRADAGVSREPATRLRDQHNHRTHIIHFLTHWLHDP